MGKWGWRFLTSRGSLWVRVLICKFGENWWRGSDRVPMGRNVLGSLWWRDILRIIQGEEGGWFESSFEKVLGDGCNIKFWNENWTRELREGMLSTRFRRLFLLSLNKREINVRQYGLLGRGKLGLVLEMEETTLGS